MADFATQKDLSALLKICMEKPRMMKKLFSDPQEAARLAQIPKLSKEQLQWLTDGQSRIRFLDKIHDLGIKGGATGASFVQDLAGDLMEIVEKNLPPR